MANGKPTPRARKPTPLAVGTKEQILGAEDVKEDPAFEVPEWGCSIHLRGFRTAERLAMEEAYIDKNTGEENEREKFKQYLLHGIVAPEFTEEEVDGLLEKAHHVIQRVYGRIMVLNAGDSAAQRSAVEMFLDQSG